MEEVALISTADIFILVSAVLSTQALSPDKCKMVMKKYLPYIGTAHDNLFPTQYTISYP
jgi:hypothetical protein